MGERKGHTGPWDASCEEMPAMNPTSRVEPQIQVVDRRSTERSTALETTASTDQKCSPSAKPKLSTLGDSRDVMDELSKAEERILKTQLDSPVTKVSYFSLYRYADKLDIFIAVTSALCSIASGASLPLLSVLFGQLASSFQRITTDSITYDEFESQLVQNVLYYVYIGIAQFGTVYVSTVGFIYVGERITLKIREQYLKAMLRQNMAYFDEMGAGEVTTRITADTNLIQDGISEKVGMTLSAVSMFISGVIIAYIKSWKLALICTPTVLCLAIAMVIGYHFTVKFTSKSLERYGVGGSVAGDAISSIRTATAFGSHERLAQQYDNHLNVAAKYGIRMRTIQAVLYAALGAIMFSTQGLGFWRGSRFLVEGEVSVGQVLTVMMALINGSHSLGSVAPHAQAFTSAVAAATKIYSAIERQSPLDPSSDEGKTLDTVKGHIELRDVKHVYPSRPDVTVLKSVSLTIPAGRTTAFVGPSGSGKSTIIGLIERFYSPVQGEIFLDGQDTSLLNLRWLRQQISLVSQEPVLFSATIFDNIKYGLNGTHFTQESESRLRERIVEAAKMANAHQFIMSLPDGYETHVGQQGFLLSGGQKQRIAIARAVVSDPKILLLDEATSALDTKSEGVVQEALDKASEGRTTIVIAHRLSTIKSADNIIVLVDGRILEQGTHDELLEARGEYFKLVEAQQLQQKDTPTVEDEDSATDHDSSEELLLSEKPHKADLEVVEKGEMMNEDVAAETAANEKAKISEEWSAWTLIRFTASLNRPELKLMMIGFGFVFLSGAVQPVQAVIYSKAITTLSLPLTMSAKIIHDADFWSIMLLVIGISSFFTSSINSISFGIGAERLICRARSKAFRTILRQDVAFFDQDENTTGALVSFLSTETHHLTGVSGLTLGTITSITISLTAAFTVALAVGWKMALVCMSVVPVVLLCGFFRVSMLAKLHAHSRIAYKTSASYASEAISSVRTVASLSREDKVLENYHDQLISQVRAGAIPSLKSSLFYALSQGIYCFCTALGFWYGGTLLGRHEYTIFQFFLCFAQVIYGANSAGSIFSRAPDMAKAKSAAAEFKTLFDRKPAIDVWSEEGEAVDSVEGNIEFRDVHFRYPTRPAQPVLCGLNLTVKAGQFAALVGASGCGKSTTISLLERFYDVSSGGVYVDGRNISQLNVNSYRSQLALVSQEPMLYQGSIRDNILMGSNDPSVTDEVIIKACKDANIYDMVMSLPEGLDTAVGSKGSMVSGGQKQRIAIARALVRNPKILLLDEATSALDSRSEEVVQAALDAAAKGRTTIAVAHRLSTIQKADIIFVLDQGRVVESGTHQELIQNKGRYFELVNMQNVGRTDT